MASADRIPLPQGGAISVNGMSEKNSLCDQRTEGRNHESTAGVRTLEMEGRTGT